MAATIVLTLSALSLLASVGLTAFGLVQIASGRRGRTPKAETKAEGPAEHAEATASVATPSRPLPSVGSWVHLDGNPPLPAEPGVLLNTLWEHLTTAECQQGECGGCRLRLLEGEVRWVREPQAAVDRSTHILACSCEPVGTVRCARP